MNLWWLLFKTSENAYKRSVFKGVRDFGTNAKVSYFIGKWCSLRQKWCSKWCSKIGTETSNIGIGNEVETHVFPEMEGHEFFFLYVEKASDKKAMVKNESKCGRKYER